MDEDQLIRQTQLFEGAFGLVAALKIVGPYPKPKNALLSQMADDEIAN